MPAYDTNLAAEFYVLLPLYHSGLLGRSSRNADLQRRDIRPLREFLGR